MSEVELHRCAASLADTFLHVFGEAAQVVVAWHRFNPGVGDADDRLLEVLIGEADALHHRPRPGAIVAVVEGLAVEAHVEAIAGPVGTVF
jgi:hypothetical protein